MCFNRISFLYIVPSLIAMFDETEYRFNITIYSPIGIVVLEALFIISPNVSVEFLSFDIIMTDELVGESTIIGDFLINETIPPLVTQAPYQSMHLLTITTGNVIDTSDTTDVTFNLFAFVNIPTGVVTISMSNVTLHKIGKILFLCI